MEKNKKNITDNNLSLKLAHNICAKTTQNCAKMSKMPKIAKKMQNPLKFFFEKTKNLINEKIPSNFPHNLENDNNLANFAENLWTLLEIYR